MGHTVVRNRHTTTMGRKPIVGGNWKCNPLGRDAIKELIAKFNEDQSKPGGAVEVVCCPTFVHIDFVASLLRKDYYVGAQNCWLEPKGAFTGEISAPMIKDIGLDWVIVGHSERRVIFKESDEVLGKKVAAAIAAGLSVIACIGELLEEREAGKTMEVVATQLSAFKAALSTEQWASVVLAYEPVWAIGTGKVATPEQAQEVHAGIRTWLAANVSPAIAAAVRIIYGGSVKGASAPGLISQTDIDGFLVGGASLTADFLTIINAAV